jgi:hypothetical protein
MHYGELHRLGALVGPLPPGTHPLQSLRGHRPLRPCHCCGANSSEEFRQACALRSSDRINALHRRSISIGPFRQISAHCLRASNGPNEPSSIETDVHATSLPADLTRSGHINGDSPMRLSTRHDLAPGGVSAGAWGWGPRARIDLATHIPRASQCTRQACLRAPLGEGRSPGDSRDAG